MNSDVSEFYVMPLPINFHAMFVKFHSKPNKNNQRKRNKKPKKIKILTLTNPLLDRESCASVIWMKLKDTSKLFRNHSINQIKSIYNKSDYVNVQYQDCKNSNLKIAKLIYLNSTANLRKR